VVLSLAEGSAEKEGSMSARLSSVTTDVRVSSSYLEALIRRADIDPPPLDKTLHYMATELANAPPSDRIGRFLDRWVGADHFDLIVGCTVVVLVGGGVLSGIIFGALTLSTSLAHAWMFVVCLTSFAVAGITASGISYLEREGDELHFGTGPARWVTVAPEKMWGLPDFVREYMAALRELDPKIRFEIADLRQNDYSLDPVLFAISGDERLPVCIWKYNQLVKLI
jgi:hypothetical protein